MRRGSVNKLGGKGKVRRGSVNKPGRKKDKVRRGSVNKPAGWEEGQGEKREC